MGQKTALLICALLGSQQGKAQQLPSLPTIQWQADMRLPAHKEQAHKGLAGPLVGQLGEYLFVAGGANFPTKMPWEGGQKVYQDRIYRYSLANDQLRLMSDLPFELKLAYPASTSVGNNFYVAGGENTQGASAAVYRYYLDSQQQLQHEQLPDLPVALTNAGMVCLGQYLYLVGGENASLVSDQIYRLDLQDLHTGWKSILTLPYPLTHAVVQADNLNEIYIVGGRKRNELGISTIYHRCFLLNPTTNILSELPSLPQPIAAATGIISEEGNLYLFGGDYAETFHRVETLLAQISLAKDQAQKEALTSEKNKIQQQHPGFSKQVWCLQKGATAWVSAGQLQGQSPVTTTALRVGQRIIIPSGEVKAGVRTDQIIVGTFIKAK